MTFDDLYMMSGELPTRHYANTDVFGIRVRTGQRRFIYHLKSKETWSDPEGHFVSFIYPGLAGRIPDMKNLKVKPTEISVRVNCSCPAWQYYGPAFWSNDKKYRVDGKPKETRSPDIRDPEGNTYLCKHAYKIGEMLYDMSFRDLTRDFALDKGRQAKGFKLLSDAFVDYLGTIPEVGEPYRSSVAKSLTLDNIEDQCVNHGFLVE